MLLAPIGTYLNYKLGTRKTVFIGIMMTSMSLALSATVHNIVLLFLFYGVLVGCGMILIVNPPFFLIDEYFPYNHHRHVLATSIIACGFPLATLIFNPLTFVLLDAVQWRITYSLFAGVLFVVGSLTTLTFRHKYPKETDPAEEDRISRTGIAPEPQPDTVTLPRRTKAIIGTIWFTVSTLKSMGYYTPFLTLVKQMEVLGIPQRQSSEAMAVAGSCEVFSRLLTSYIGDYFKGKILYMYVLCCVLLCIQNALGTMAYTFTHLAIYAAALGLFGGPIIAAMYSSCSEVLQGQHVPVIFTTFRVGLGIGALAGPTLAGVIFDHTNSFLGVFYMNSVIYLVASSLYAFIIYLNKRKPKWCFPDVGEELSLIENAKGLRTADSGAICSAIQTDNPVFVGVSSVPDSSGDSTDGEYNKLD
ncbi:hypothetical protein LSH36_191g01053 [Paralvinella palmiformis]|uniref:Major facilitator superfamily (MFS) profile domain-containing protein n=1 Tax=Paralvinella palmiformis TaxID=53620 RepID=A0AAD9JQM5_9ANNE|nr:hypothetical protein LSH36_191g01053 [Paralvinella palmiformis]